MFVDEFALHAVVDDEEGGGGGHGAQKGGGEACVHAPQGAAQGVAREERGILGRILQVRLEAGFDGVEWVEREVDCETC